MDDQKSVKRLAAEARQAEYDKMTDQQKLDRLDKMFGKDQGASKERKKIAARMANPKAIVKPKAEPKVVPQEAQTTEQEQS